MELKIGDNGPNVLAWQNFLISIGYGLTADGDFGPKTKTATTLFQHDKALNGDGIVGRNTVLAAAKLGFSTAGLEEVAPVAGEPTETAALDAASQKKLAKVHPELAKRVAAMIEALAAKGRDVRVVQGLRSYAEQNALYEQGRSKPGDKVTNAKGGYSNHNFGLAADLCPFKDDKPQWEDNAGFKAIGTEAKRQALEWGGDWLKFPDRPHVQLHGLSIAQCRKHYDEGGLKAVWKAIDRLLQ